MAPTTTNDIYIHPRRRKRSRNSQCKLMNLFLIAILFLGASIPQVQAQQQQQRHEKNEQEVAEAKQRRKEQQKRSSETKKKQRKDSQIIRKILTASSNGEHYKVLGLKHYEIKLPFSLPRISNPIFIPVFHPKDKDIKKAYRKRARLVHPDKNTSPDANEAFDALDRATAILLDERLRTEYDLVVREIRERRLQERIAFLKHVVGVCYAISSKVSGVGKRALGPFLTPVLVLGALIV